MVASVLQRPTLVLNRNWQPVNVATVARAPVWKPLYAAHDVRIESGSKFVSEVYWNAALEK